MMVSPRFTRYAGGSAALLFLLALVFSRQINNLWEDAMFAFDHSTSRAELYGERHLSSHDVAYDIDRAEYFYTELAKIDATYPYVNHQLARISFLRGNFNTALFYIN